MFYSKKPEFNSKERKIVDNIKKELKGYSLKDAHKLLQKITEEIVHETII